MTTYRPALTVDLELVMAFLGVILVFGMLTSAAAAFYRVPEEWKK